jgi:hypothetical protein
VLAWAICAAKQRFGSGMSPDLTCNDPLRTTTNAARGIISLNTSTAQPHPEQERHA